MENETQITQAMQDPLIHLIASMHQGTTLEERVRKLRWVRRKPGQTQTLPKDVAFVPDGHWVLVEVDQLEGDVRVRETRVESGIEL